MDLRTDYLGMTLRTPLVPSASPLSTDLDRIRQLEDVGASAIVMYSLFEEQLTHEMKELYHYTNYHTESFAEALSYFPEAEEYKLGPDQYLEHIEKIKAAVDIPVIASLNGSSLGGWSSFAKLIAESGADAIELNLYNIPTDINMTGTEVEEQYLEVIRRVKSSVDIPVAVKVGPYFSNMANMAKRMVEAGASGLVLFNRFYQPDIDLENLEVRPDILLSTPYDMRLPLRWTAILHGRINASLAATSGIHSAEDVIKMVMVGANVTMMAAALLRHGINHIGVVEQAVSEWLEENEYESLKQMQGSMSQINAEDPSAFERAQYMRALTSYKLTV